MTSIDDDQADHLIYAGRLNALQGEPGGGKTWVALHACAAAIAAHHHVLFVDLEDHAVSTVMRLQTLGLSRDQIVEQFHYIRPSQPLTGLALEYVERQIVELGIGLVVIDSVGELLALQGVPPNDDDAVARIYRAVLRRLADLGPAVVLLDHVPKSKDGPQLWAIGSQRKKAAIDGAAFMVETVIPFAKNQPGRLALRTAKDRHGNFVTGAIAAEIEVKPTDGGAGLTLDVRAPETGADGKPRWTINMQRVSDYLIKQPTRRATRSDIAEALGMPKPTVTKTVAQMVAEGWVVDHGAGGANKARDVELVEGFDSTRKSAADDGF